MRRAKTYEVNLEFVSVGQVNTVSDAQAWGRIAARMGWDLDTLNVEVAPEFRQIAKEAYQQKMRRL